MRGRPFSAVCHQPPAPHRGTVIVVLVLFLVFAQIAIVGLVLSNAQDQHLGVDRVRTVQAFYAAEAGLNMAAREIVLNVDEDGDGGIGSISNDGDEGNDPAVGLGRVCASLDSVAGQLTITGHGTAGLTRRRLRATFATSAGGAPGLLAECFVADAAPSVLADINWDGSPVGATAVASINWTPGSDAVPFWPGGPVNHYGVRFVGAISIPAPGDWTIHLESDDGSRLLIDGEVVVDNDGLHAVQRRGGTVSLEAGDHRIEILYFQRSGGCGLVASWSGPTVSSRVVIPASAFSH